MPLLNTSGNVTADAYGGGAAAVPNYIESCFSTYLYTGNGSTQTITNGIDLAGKGGLVWMKDRTAVFNHELYDTSRGATWALRSNSTTAQYDQLAGLTAFGATGFSLGNSSTTNLSGESMASWTFRKQPKFFDVATGTVDANGNIVINHSLGVSPGCVILKDVSAAQNWFVWHRSYGANDQYQFLNTTAAQATLGSPNTWVISSTQVGIQNPFAGPGGGPFTPGDQYVAYLFAHNAGGFGLTGTDNVISCGSYYNSGSAPVNVTLGYEPQWILIKKTDSAQNWFLVDTMRGDSLTAQNVLKPNLPDAETVNAGAPGYPAPTATGFTTYLGAEGTFIYIAIRRGPMKVPTSGTSVFLPTVGLDGTSPISTGFPVDMFFDAERSGSAINTSVGSRLTGNQKGLITSSLSAELDTIGASVCWTNNTGYTPFVFGSSTGGQYAFRRAPSFFDEVCYTGDGVARTVTHNLTVAPELMIVKNRSGVSEWTTYQAPIGASQVMRLNSTIAAFADASVWDGTAPTSSVFSIGTSGRSNDGGSRFVIYLFASCPGVSKVGSYTGNGTTQTINCGFTGGARFVLIKRTDATGDWYVYDTARGMTTLTDPYLLLNSTAAESATLGSVTTVSTGFAVNASILAEINASGGTYIYLAIA